MARQVGAPCYNNAMGDVPFLKTGLSLTENALIVLSKRYLRKDDEGNVIERPEDMFERVSLSIAKADLNYNKDANIELVTEEFYDLMTSLKFMPNSPTLMNAGRELGQLSACFVLPIEDSIESIFETVKHTAMIHKSGGGTGFSFSSIRPEGDRVKTTHGVASGPVSFMNIFDVATETIKQGGTRRGANMGILRVDHPDIERFISLKINSDKLSNFNISVALTEAFMESVEKGSDYDLINPRSGKAVKRISAQKIFDMIVESAWSSGDPGIIFIDRINKANPTPHIGQIESTNPCGEQPLLPYESCNLGSINLGLFVRDGDCGALGRNTGIRGLDEGYSSLKAIDEYIDYDGLKEVVWKAVHFLDNVIDVNRFPIPKIKEMTLRTRKIGLGVMGFADMLIRLSIPYNSIEAIQVAERVMSFIDRESKNASMELARERGNFPAYKGSIYDCAETPYMRNATTTTIAPTGTISIIAGASSGIEPLFAVSFIRKVLDGNELIEAHPEFIRAVKAKGIYTPELMEQVASSSSIQNIAEIPDDIKRIFKTSMDISPLEHVEIQAVFQRHIDNAVSKTINFLEDAAKDDVKEAYILAWKKGLKGITIYRYGSKPVQVLNLKQDAKEQSLTNGPALINLLKPEKSQEKVAVVPPQDYSDYRYSDQKIRKIEPRPRPIITKGITKRVKTGCGNLYVTVNWDEKDICEVFAQMGKAGGCAACQMEAESRLISLALRSGINIRSIVKQLAGIRCPSPGWQDGGQILSCPDAMAKVLSKAADIEIEGEKSSLGSCPECGAVLEPESGCFMCRLCGFSRCD